MALANLLGRNKTLKEDTTFRFDSQRNLSRRDEEMFRLNGASIRQTKEVGRGTWAKRRDLGHCIWRLYGSRSQWDWNRTDKTSPSLFSTSFQISNDFSSEHTTEQTQLLRAVFVVDPCCSSVPDYTFIGSQVHFLAWHFQAPPPSHWFLSDSGVPVAAFPTESLFLAGWSNCLKHYQ